MGKWPIDQASQGPGDSGLVSLAWSGLARFFLDGGGCVGDVMSAELRWEATQGRRECFVRHPVWTMSREGMLFGRTQANKLVAGRPGFGLRRSAVLRRIVAWFYLAWHISWHGLEKGGRGCWQPLLSSPCPLLFFFFRCSPFLISFLSPLPGSRFLPLRRFSFVNSAWPSKPRHAMAR